MLGHPGAPTGGEDLPIETGQQKEPLYTLRMIRESRTGYASLSLAASKRCEPYKCKRHRVLLQGCQAVAFAYE